MTTPSVYMHAFCEDCGTEVDVCTYCSKRRVYFSNYCRPCCSDHDSPPDPNLAPQFLCSPCESSRREKSVEIMGYIYVPLRALEPLSPHNFARIAVYRNIYDGPTDPVERAEEALAAFQQEFSFTGDIQKASEIYMSFYKNVPPSDKPVRPGPVSLQEISQGQHVSGEQFFQALRA